MNYHKKVTDFFQQNKSSTNYESFEKFINNHLKTSRESLQKELLEKLNNNTYDITFDVLPIYEWGVNAETIIVRFMEKVILKVKVDYPYNLNVEYYTPRINSWNLQPKWAGTTKAILNILQENKIHDFIMEHHLKHLDMIEKLLGDLVEKKNQKHAVYRNNVDRCSEILYCDWVQGGKFNLGTTFIFDYRREELTGNAFEYIPIPNKKTGKMVIYNDGVPVGEWVGYRGNTLYREARAFVYQNSEV